MTSFDNGYGGKVTYNYEKVANIDKICTGYNGDNPDQFIKKCGISPVLGGFGGGDHYLASYYRVTNIIADNGLGQKKKTEYSYSGGSVGYVSKYYRWGSIPGTGIGIAKLSGLQFLGYPQVQIKVSDVDNPSKVLSHVRAYTTQFVENDSCVMVDPRYGMDYKSEILEAGGAVIGSTDTNVITRQTPNFPPPPPKI